MIALSRVLSLAWPSELRLDVLQTIHSAVRSLTTLCSITQSGRHLDESSGSSIRCTPARSAGNENYR
jgi:hypothetical protein